MREQIFLFTYQSPISCDILTVNFDAVSNKLENILILLLLEQNM